MPRRGATSPASTTCRRPRPPHTTTSSSTRQRPRPFSADHDDALSNNGVDDDEDYGNEDEDGHVYHRAHHHHQQQHNSGRLGKRGRGEDSGAAEDNAGGKRVQAVASVEQSVVVQQLKGEVAAATADPHGAGCGGPVLADVGRGVSAPEMEEMGVTGERIREKEVGAKASIQVKN